mgnify:CR=1 FL=1
MLCVICISRGGSASVSFSEVEERAVDLRNVSTVPSQSEPTHDVRSLTPNIIGGTNLCSGWGGVEDTGVFKKTGRTQSAGGMYDNGINLQFDASWSSALFGAGSTVQPPALQSLACIKT